MARLLSDLAQEQLTAEEKAELDAWIAAHPDNKVLAERLQDPGYRNGIFATWSPESAEVSLDRVKQHINRAKKRSFLQRMAAASIIILAGGITYFQVGQHHIPPPIVYKNDVAPGTDKAILTLADGTKISLTDVPDGQVASTTGSDIVKTAKGNVVYNATGVNTGDNTDLHPVYNTLETPVGGQHRIQLPDGTRVWLNAMSSLKFPQSFTGLHTRTVELSGEAYFEVAPDKTRPFLVYAGRQSVSVLGTHFDIRSYRDEPSVSTTLLEGVVIATDNNAPAITHQLRPGDQLLSTAQSASVKQVDTLNVVDWKNGEFIFHNETLKDMMGRIARWYDVEIIFKDEAAGHETFSGSISRYDNVSQLLKPLQLTGRVHFDIEGRKIFVNR